MKSLNMPICVGGTEGLLCCIDDSVSVLKTINQNPSMKTESYTGEHISVKNWLITMFITAIPFIGWIMLFVWAFGDGTHPDKANWAKAVLLLFAIAIGFNILIMVLFGAGLIGVLSSI
jgi:hypothetical protein